MAQDVEGLNGSKGHEAGMANVPKITPCDHVFGFLPAVPFHAGP